MSQTKVIVIIISHDEYTDHTVPSLTTTLQESGPAGGFAGKKLIARFQNICKKEFFVII